METFLAGLDSPWDDRLPRGTLGVRNALEEGETLPPFPTGAWTLVSQNVFEARNAPPPSPTAAGIAPEGADPVLESNPLAAGVTPPEGEAPASEGDLRIRGQAEPGNATLWPRRTSSRPETGMSRYRDAPPPPRRQSNAPQRW